MDPDRRAAIRLGGLALAGVAGCFRDETPSGVPDETPIDVAAGALLLPRSALPVDRRWYRIDRESGTETGRATFVTYGETTPSSPRRTETARDQGVHLLEHRVQVYPGGGAADAALREWVDRLERDESRRDTRPDVGDAAAAVEPPDGGYYRLRYRENNVLVRFENTTAEPEGPAVVLQSARAHLSHLAAVATGTAGP